MFCPKCGKRQFSDDIRFCAKCGLPLEAAKKSLTTGGAAIEQRSSKSLSPKTKGILQGIAIIPAGIGLMAVIDIFYEALGAGMMAGLYSTLTMVVLAAIARILYAVVVEEGNASQAKEPFSPSMQNQLPPADPALVAGRESPANTGEIVHPRSVTEHTTRELHSHR